MHMKKKYFKIIIAIIVLLVVILAVQIYSMRHNGVDHKNLEYLDERFDSDFKNENYQIISYEPHYGRDSYYCYIIKLNEPSKSKILNTDGYLNGTTAVKDYLTQIDEPVDEFKNVRSMVYADNQGLGHRLAVVYDIDDDIYHLYYIEF